MAMRSRSHGLLRENYSLKSLSKRMIEVFAGCTGTSLEWQLTASSDGAVGQRVSEPIKPTAGHLVRRAVSAAEITEIVGAIVNLRTSLLDSS